MRCPSRSGRAIAEGALDFVNAAYVEGGRGQGPDRRDRARARIARPRRARRSRAHARRGGPIAGRVPAGSRPARGGSSTCWKCRPGAAAPASAIDATEVESMRAELARMVDAHRRTLDQLATGVAIFGADHTLTFYNTAYRSLWDLDPAFLDQSPSNSAVLDRLRAARKLPEEQDFRQWKNQLHEAYRALEAREVPLASAGRAHAARGHHAQSRRRRDLSVRRRHRAARSRAPLRRADPRAGRDARQSVGSGRGVCERRAAAAVQSRLLAACGSSRPKCWPSGRISKP